MTAALCVLFVLALMGAFDTIVYHELVARLPATPAAWGELRLHAWRDFVYGVLFASLAWFQPHGWLVVPLAMLLAIEIAITLSDFIVEDHTRKLPSGERSMHAIMGITYGIFVALLFPQSPRLGASADRLRSDILRLAVVDPHRVRARRGELGRSRLCGIARAAPREGLTGFPSAFRDCGDIEKTSRRSTRRDAISGSFFTTPARLPDLAALRANHLVAGDAVERRAESGMFDSVPITRSRGFGCGSVSAA